MPTRRAQRLPIAIAIAILGCETPVATQPGDTGGDPTHDSEPAASSTGTGMGDTTASADDMPPMSTTTPAMTTTTQMTDSGMPPPPFEPKFCALADIDETADPTLVIDAGDGAGQIPTVIGDVLMRNCGCHYTDNVEGYVDYISNKVPMATHADFHADFEGVFPMGFEDMPVYKAVEQRVVFQLPLPMPPLECNVEGEPPGITIDEADRDLLGQWLAAAAPDGASWP